MERIQTTFLFECLGNVVLPLCLGRGRNEGQCGNTRTSEMLKAILGLTKSCCQCNEVRSDCACSI